MLSPATWTLIISAWHRPWDAGGMHSRTRSETFRTIMLMWLMRLLCRPVIIHGLDRTMTMYTENGHDYDDNYGFSPVDSYPG